MVYKLLPLTRQLYAETSKIAWALLFVFFLLALVFAYFKAPAGSSDFLDILKRLVITMLLLVSFPMISDFIQDVGSGITKSIAHASGYSAFFEMLKNRLDAIVHSGWKGSILFVDDVVLSLLSFLSYLLVYASRYVMLATYQFYWALLCVLAPILIAFYVFRKTSSVTGGLYQSLIEVSLWPFVWEIMGVMFMSLWAGDKNYIEGSYITVIVLNLIISLSMVLTPYLVHSLVRGAVSSTAGTIGGIATATILTAPVKVKAISKLTQAIVHSKTVSHTKSFLEQWNQKQMMSRLLQKNVQIPKPPPPPEGKSD